MADKNIVPCQINKIKADNIIPIPKVDARIKEVIPSNIALVNKIQKFRKKFW